MLSMAKANNFGNLPKGALKDYLPKGIRRERDQMDSTTILFDICNTCVSVDVGDDGHGAQLGTQRQGSGWVSDEEREEIWQCKCMEDLHKSFRLFPIDGIENCSLQSSKSLVIIF
ncbi:uncharacterized protein LOC121976657 isoform X2 [Zingiber officinale]|uniref:uncharacterized protein LOC121976657 isoform X2 n=1 Tax=Zingiber officinale TaxID=94328 RepID=UPI001C4C2FDF|nr:uncharacterized protein LOC121976657 isoform X2 [Zingiber officinale]